MNRYLFWKPILDFILAFLLLVGCLPLLFLILVSVAVIYRSNPIFCQKRIGQFGKSFTIYKVRTIFKDENRSQNLIKFLRKSKLDELPQLINIVKGEMSFVGPRPDISGYYDLLSGPDRLLLNLKPGITSLASIKYRHEDELLSKQDNPLLYNDTVIFPDKVSMNVEYLNKISLKEDISIFWKTINSL